MFGCCWLAASFKCHYTCIKQCWSPNKALYSFWGAEFKLAFLCILTLVWRIQIFLTLRYYVLDFPANNIVKFLVGFTNKGTEDFIIESLDASFRYPQDYQFFIQNFTALPLNTVVPPQRQATFEYSFIPAEPMGGRPFGLVINLNYKDLNVRRFWNYFYSFKLKWNWGQEGKG